MPTTLTRYRTPQIRYGRAQLAASPWTPCGGWYRHADGSYRRVWARRSRRALTARRALVVNVRGWWHWQVEVFELETRAIRRICARGVNGYALPHMAFPFADLAAATAD